MVAQGQRALGCLIPTFKRQVCGVNCDEMDLVEANKYAFHAAAHTAFDGSGRTNGWGGGNANRAFGSAEYSLNRSSSARNDASMSFERSGSGTPLDGDGI